MSASSEFRALLLDLWADLQSVNVLWQVGALVICVAAGWLLSRSYGRRLAGHAPADAAQARGIGNLKRLMFPVSSLVLVLIAKAVLRHWQSTHLLNVAAALLLAMALIRISIYVMRHTFAPSAWLRASERWISWIAWIGVAVYLTGLWPYLREILLDIGFTAGQQKFSLLLVLQGTLSIVATLLVTLWLGQLAESRLMRATSLQVSLRVMFAKLAQILLLLAAFLIALPALGIDLTVLSVFGGMLGVGIGFGLQKIAANYISGFIILMDRSVSLGDVVTIGEHSGTLTRMTARYVVVRKAGGLEAIIPNETIITSTVVNHSFSSRKVQASLSLQVAYATDLDEARRIMIECAAAHPRVLKDPAPGTLITAFADSGINLELGVWVDDPDKGLGGLRSDLYGAIWREFRKRGIEIPFPQREIRVLGMAGTEPPNQK
ncbi:MAG: mechanosensitive ion channel [Burkholderiales bacterium]|nr:mechanosensitive ion channel [Burkholderiales bacterium]